MYFHTDSERTVNWLAAVLDTAAINGRSVRLDVNDRGELKVKVGSGAWCDLVGTPDMNRDNSFDNVVPEKDYSKGMTFVEVVKDLIDMDALSRAEPLIRFFYSKVIQEALDVPEPEPFTFGKTSEVPRA